jgi:hypothetical protein
LQAAASCGELTQVIKVVFGNYKSKWMTAGVIEGQSGNFVTETQGLFKALGARISKEDNDLYPIAEKLGI